MDSKEYETRAPRVFIKIRPVIRGDQVKMVTTKRLSVRDVVVMYDDGTIKDSAGEVWTVEPMGNGDYKAVG